MKKFNFFILLGSVFFYLKFAHASFLKLDENTSFLKFESELPPIPQECVSPYKCIQLLSITTDVTTSIGVSRKGVKSGLWVRILNNKITDLIMHQPKNAPLHDVISLSKKPFGYIPNQERDFLKDDDTEVMLKFISHCDPIDFSYLSCTRFQIKFKTDKSPQSRDWLSVDFNINQNFELELNEVSGFKKITTLYLKAHAYSLGIFGGEKKAYFTKIQFN
jgi:hypothetical protein